MALLSGGSPAGAAGTGPTVRDQQTAHVGTIDLEQLREFQMKAYSGQKEDKTFKPTPPDFDYKGAYERRKGTMFECFCAKKTAD